MKPLFSPSILCSYLFSPYLDEAVKQAFPDPHVEPRHREGKQPAPDPSEEATEGSDQHQPQAGREKLGAEGGGILLTYEALGLTGQKVSAMIYLSGSMEA